MQSFTQCQRNFVNIEKTMTWEPIKNASVKEGHALQFSELIQFDPQIQVGRHIVRDSNADNSEADNKGEETSERLKQETPIPIESTKSEDFESGGESPLIYTFVSSSSGRSGASDSSRHRNSDAECSDKSILKPVSSIEKPQALDALTLSCPDNFSPPTASVPHDDTEGNSFKLMSSNVSSSCHGNAFSKDLKIGTSPELEESMGIQTRWPEGAFSCGITNANVCKSHDPCDSGRQNSEENKNTSKRDEIPSFNLEF